jgi:hypothetical protein
MLRKFIGTVALVATMAGTAAAQGRGRGPSDHWMTIDSLVAAVGATDSQKAGIKMHLDALNAVYKTRMDAFTAARASGSRPDSATSAKWQGDAMAHYEEIGKLLNAAQKTKFDALPKPRLAGGGRRMGGGGN